MAEENTTVTLSPPIKTLTEWKKRLQVGVQIRQVWNFRTGPTDHVLTITGVQTQDVYGTTPGVEKRIWMHFPKRSEIEFTEKGWIVFEKEKTIKIAEYEWVIKERT